MFGRFVKIDGQEIFVSCSPQTPLSEVLRRAAMQMEKIERGKADADPIRAAYRAAAGAPLRALAAAWTTQPQDQRHQEPALILE